MRPTAKASALFAITIATSLTLAACGGSATVEENTTSVTSVAPLERSPQSGESSTEASESASGNGANQPAPRDNQPQDRGAREVEEIPEHETPRSEEDLAYLKELSEGGINIEGVESQMIGTATTICNPEGTGIDAATLPAVAGQLYEQRRSDMPAEEIATLIENAARKAYC